MCFERCARCIGCKLLILALLSIAANILLYFPNGETRFASEHHLSKYVECLHGILGGGLLVSNKLVHSCEFNLKLLGITASLPLHWFICWMSCQRESLELYLKKNNQLYCTTVLIVTINYRICKSLSLLSWELGYRLETPNAVLEPDLSEGCDLFKGLNLTFLFFQWAFLLFDVHR